MKYVAGVLSLMGLAFIVTGCQCGACGDCNKVTVREEKRVETDRCEPTRVVSYQTSGDTHRRSMYRGDSARTDTYRNDADTESGSQTVEPQRPYDRDADRDNRSLRSDNDTQRQATPRTGEGAGYNDAPRDVDRPKRDQTADNRAQASTSDTIFVRDAAQANLTEIEIGRLGVSKATNPEVRRYAQRMIDDHTKAQSELKTAASAADIDVPEKLDAHHRGMVDDFQDLSGGDFDRKYMDMMVNDHGKVVEKFEQQSQSADNDDLRSFASKTLPTLREHLRMARDIQGKLKGQM